MSPIFRMHTTLRGSRLRLVSAISTCALALVAILGCASTRITGCEAYRGVEFQKQGWI